MDISSEFRDTGSGRMVEPSGGPGPIAEIIRIFRLPRHIDATSGKSSI
jgi:hypothetical protein